MQIQIQAGETLNVVNFWNSLLQIAYLQKLRSIAMREKRQARYREYLAGKRDWDTVYIRQEMPGAWKDPGPNPRDQFGTKFNFD